MKVIVFSTKYYDQEQLDRANTNQSHQITYTTQGLDISTVKLAKGYEAVCVLVSDRVNRDIIQHLSEIGVKLLVLRSTGFDNIDLLAAENAGIKVMRVPSYSPESIAEHATALILTLARKIHKAFNRVRDNNFSLDNLMGFTLAGKTVGVIGTGKIGRAFCSIMLGFGCKVIAYDVKQSQWVLEKGIDYVALDELLASADIISIHCPLTVDTHYLFNKITFAKCKKGFMLINTSRGGLIKTTDAAEALKSGQMGFLGIDVYEDETGIFFKDLSGAVVVDDVIERLMSFGNVLITPHQAFFTREAIQQIAKITIQNLTDFQNGISTENQVYSTMSNSSKPIYETR